MKSNLLMLTILLSCFGTSARSQKPDSCKDVYLKGYLIKEFVAAEIKKLSGNKKSSFPMDIYEKTYFPAVNKENQILSQSIDSLKSFRADEIYFLPYHKFTGNIKEFCKSFISGNKIALKKFNFSFFKSRASSNKFLYKIFYYECKAKNTLVLNSAHSRFILNIPFDKKAKYLNCYFISSDVILQEIEEIVDAAFVRVCIN